MLSPPAHIILSSNISPRPTPYFKLDLFIAKCSGKRLKDYDDNDDNDDDDDNNNNNNNNKLCDIFSINYFLERKTNKLLAD